MKKKKKVPMRQCVGCMESMPKKELVRIVANKEGEIKVDLTGKAAGRGVYICKNVDCLKLADKKHALARSLQREISKEILDELYEVLGKNEK